MTDLIRQFVVARQRSVPLVAIQTADPSQTISNLMAGPMAEDSAPIMQWDCSSGVMHLNTPGRAAIETVLGTKIMREETANPATWLQIMARLPAANRDSKQRGSVVFLHNFHRFIEEIGIAQPFWNLRDSYKATGRMVVMLGPSFQLPPELVNDVLVIDEPLPTLVEAKKIVSDLLSDAGGMPDEAEIDCATEAVAGLPAFAIEQTTALSLTRDKATKQIGFNLPQLWQRKLNIIRATPGLSAWQGNNSFDNIGGNENIKQFIRRIFGKRNKYGAIVFIDEIEKALAGSSGSAADSSGTSQAVLGKLLTFMQDSEADGMLLLGVPGSGKTAVGKCTGSLSGIPTIFMSIGDMKGSLVGQTEQRVSNALKVVQSVSQGKTLFIATCNSIANLTPELRRRFWMGTWFFDLPDGTERKAIWDIYLKRYEMKRSKAMPSDDNWTGAEIESCCKLAAELGVSLLDASEYIVPTAESMGEDLTRLRTMASGRFLSASYRGKYRIDRPQEQARTTRRGLVMEGLE